MEELKGNKKEYIKFGIGVFTWLLIIFGLSYAYFSITFNSTNTTNATVETGTLDIDFETSEYINNNAMWPTNDADIFEMGDKSVFSVTRASDNTVDSAISYDIYLVDIDMDENYKYSSSDIKWRLYREQVNVGASPTEPTAESTPALQGTFDSIEVGDDTLKLNTTPFVLPAKGQNDVGKIDYYTLYIWISNDPNRNQTELLEGFIEAKIQIVASSPLPN